MNTIINTKLDTIIKHANSLKINLEDDYAFNLLLLNYFFFDGKPISDCWNDIVDYVVDGANDGGIDFVFYDDENDKVILGQSKYKGSLSPTDIITELNKMSNTVANFVDGNTGAYNDKVKKQLQNAIDRLPDESVGNIEYNIYSTANYDKDSVYQKISNQHAAYSEEMVNLFHENDIVERINETMISVDTVNAEKVSIDKSKNWLCYETDDAEGVIVNLSSKSLIKLYNSYADEGLFDLNIRKYIANRAVDDGIKNTLDNDRESFWFLNNGIIIACEDFDLDGNSVNLYEFSIVNGGQTTNLIGKYKGNNSKEFYIPCKIVRSKRKKNKQSFFTKIAEATNSQKPILPRDLKSNSPEMRQLKMNLKDSDIELEIKRGDKPLLKNPKYKIKNDELGQYILSFVLQKPGTSRSGKKKIFENNELYNSVYRVKYFSDDAKKEFLLSSVDLITRTKHTIEELKTTQQLNELQKEILKNGTHIIYALMGVLFRIINMDISKEELLQDPSVVKNGASFEYRNVLDYSYDELDDYLKKMIVIIVRIVTQGFKQNSNDTSLEITSVSNYFKTDKKYYDLIIPSFVESFDYDSGQELLKNSCIFKQ